MTWAQTACILCECNCGIEVELDGRTLDRIRGDKAHPGTQGYTCNKAMRLDRYQNGPHRLTSPMRRQPDGSYEEIDWDTAIAKDPERSMIVIDPVLTDTARLADFHLRVQPGTDAWCLAAMVAVLVQEDLVDHEFLAAHVSGAQAVMARFADVDVARYAEACGVDEALIRAAARRIAGATSVSVFEDPGIQQTPNS